MDDHNSFLSTQWTSETTLLFAVRDTVIDLHREFAAEIGEFALLALSREVVRRLFAPACIPAVADVLTERSLSEARQA